MVPHAMLQQILQQHAEWLFVSSEGGAQSLRRTEIDIAVSQRRLLLSCWTEKGSRTWRILDWHWNGESLLLDASRRMGAERTRLELIPRTSAKTMAATIRAARQMQCERLAQLACDWQSRTTIERCALSPGMRRGQPGRYARILLRWKGERIAVTGPVVTSAPSSVDAFLSSTLLWFTRTRERARGAFVEQLWLIVSGDLAKPVGYRIALLRESLKSVTRVLTVDDNLNALSPVSCPDRKELWTRKLARFPSIPLAILSEQSHAIAAEAPEAIDVVHSRHGETLRYFGLPFARVRSLLGVERVWFGIDRL